VVSDQWSVVAILLKHSLRSIPQRIGFLQPVEFDAATAIEIKEIFPTTYH
jgi:hypothetical protein